MRDELEYTKSGVASDRILSLKIWCKLIADSLSSWEARRWSEELGMFKPSGILVKCL